MQSLKAAATAGVIGVAGDVLMQWREGRRSDTFDWERAGRLAAFRAVHAPVIDYSWRYFDRAIPFTGAVGVVARVVADQALLMPPSLIAFFLSQGAMEGLSAAACVERVKDAFIPTAIVCTPYWCVVHSLTFSVVPVDLRIGWASVCAVGWNAIISDQNQAAIQRADAPADCKAEKGG